MSISAINGSNLLISQKKYTKVTTTASFETVLKEQTKNQSINEMFSNLFPTYNVSCKIGNCDVSSTDWKRNDFPSWKYFENDTKADALNSWRASGEDVSSMDPNLLDSWRKTDDRKMVIIIPDKLAEKIESNPSYARQILNKVYAWQTNHSTLEKTLSEGYGYDGELSTFQDSYLLKLDEDGNVTDYVVTGPGYDNSFKKEESYSSTKNSILKGEKTNSINQSPVNTSEFIQDNITGRILYDYTSSLGLLAATWGHKKRM